MNIYTLILNILICIDIKKFNTDPYSMILHWISHSAFTLITFAFLYFKFRQVGILCVSSVEHFCERHFEYYVFKTVIFMIKEYFVTSVAILGSYQ